LSVERVRSGSRQYQRGWVGLVVLLLALVIVAFLAQNALRQYGMLGAPTRVAKPGERPRGPGESTQAPLDSSGAAPAPTTAIERARGVEQTLQEGAQDISKRIDEQTK
jgi:hypothetical protein